VLKLDMPESTWGQPESGHRPADDRCKAMVRPNLGLVVETAIYNEAPT
jgi:hypothetical protein